MGPPESVAMIAAGLRWKLNSIKEKISPVIASEPVVSQFIRVNHGAVVGIQ